MTPKERIKATLGFADVDRVPTLGGFLTSASQYTFFGEISKEEFHKAPYESMAKAYRSLGVDGVILMRIPQDKEGLDEYREVTREGFAAHQERFQSAEGVLAYVESLPTPEEALRQFDAAKWREEFCAGLMQRQHILGDMCWIPTQWDIVHPTFEWYNVFGYSNYMEFLALYPNAADRLFGSEVEVKRTIASIVVDVYRQLDIPAVVHIGTDICGNGGPIVNPAYLRRYYFPHIKRSLAPLHEAGFKTVWHSDGIITPIVDDILDCGVSGFQGFQWELGLRLDEIVAKRTVTGEKLIIFAGPSVTTTMYRSGEDIKAELRYIVDTAFSASGLFILPNSDLMPNIPLENIAEAYRYAADYSKSHKKS